MPAVFTPTNTRRECAPKNTMSWRDGYPKNWPVYLSVSDLVAQLKQRDLAYEHVFQQSAPAQKSIQNESANHTSSSTISTTTSSCSSSDRGDYEELVVKQHRHLLALLVEHLKKEHEI